MKKLLALFCAVSLPLVSSAAVPFDKLTYEQKLGQTLFAFTDMDNYKSYEHAIKKGLVGGMLIQWGDYDLKTTKSTVAQLQEWAKQSPHKLPLLISIDYEGGTVYSPVSLGFEFLPTNMMLAAAGDENLTARLYYFTAKHLQSAGVHINFSPVLDVNTNPQNPIIGVRSFGSDPERVTRHGMAAINGLRAGGVMPVAKHFPGHGDTAQDTHYSLPVMRLSKQDMQKHIAPFKKAIAQKVPAIMSVHIIYTSLDGQNPASFSKKILTDLLRKELKFKGLIFSDSLDMQGAKKALAAELDPLKANNSEYITAVSVKKALKAGTNVALLGRFLNAEKTYAEMKLLLDKDPMKKEINDSAKKVYEAKKALGLLDDKTPEAADEYMESFRATVREAARKALTVYKADEQVIRRLRVPASEKKQTLCAVFFTSSRYNNQTYSFKKPFMETGWNAEFFNAPVRPQAADIASARQCAQKADVFVIGTMQMSSRPLAEQKAAVKTLLKEFPDAVLVSTMNPYEAAHYPEAKTVLLTYGAILPAIEAAADALLGTLEPQGVLPVNLE